MNNSRLAGLRALVRTGAKFLIVGGISTVIEVAVFNLCFYAFGWGDHDWGLVVSKIVASGVAMINAYLGNREWAFKDRANHGRALELALFLAVNLACMALGAVIIWAGAWGVEQWRGFGPGPFLLNIINLASIAIVVVVRFVLYHGIVFKTVKREDGAG